MIGPFGTPTFRLDGFDNEPHTEQTWIRSHKYDLNSRALAWYFSNFDQILFNKVESFTKTEKDGSNQFALIHNFQPFMRLRARFRMNDEGRRWIGFHIADSL